jgi:hypothetical protein
MINVPNHCIRELEWDDNRKDWYAILVRISDGETVVVGDLNYILLYVHQNNDISIIETGEFI